MNTGRFFSMVRAFRFSLIVLLLLAACSRDDDFETPVPDSTADTEVAVAWFDLSLRLVEGTPGFTPPVASRAFGYLGVGLYEGVVPGLPGKQSLGGRLNGLEPLPDPASGEAFHWPAVANSTLAELSRKLFRTTESGLLKAIDELEESLARDFREQAGKEVFDRSAERGRAIAEAIYSWSSSDGGHEGFAHNFTDDYDPPAGPGMWIPTLPEYLPAMQPHWGENRPFVIEITDKCQVAPTPSYSEEAGSEFYSEALEVYQTVGQLTDEQRNIALFWADDPVVTSTPPGHWISILNQVLTEREYPLEAAAEAYARLGIVLADAFIACWDAKYKYNLIRPVSYIQEVIDPDWNNPEVTDPVLTPPFPEYPSGHSVQSGAAATVLTELFGDLAFTDHTHDALGKAPRSFSSFWEAAEEAAISRLYGGIHFRAAIEKGITHGQCIGEKVNAIEF